MCEGSAEGYGGTGGSGQHTPKYPASKTVKN